MSKNEKLSQIRTESHRQRRLENYPLLEDVDWLRRRYEVEVSSLEEMAEEVGCQMSMVSAALARYEIPVRTPEQSRIARGKMKGPRPRHEELYDENWMRRKYIDEDLTIVEIATELGCSNGIVQKAVLRFSLPVRSERRSDVIRSDAFPQLHDKDWLTDQYVTQGKTAEKIASELGCQVSTVFSSVSRLRISKFPGRARTKKDKTLPNGVKRKNGYFQEYRPQHPFADERGYVLQHRLVVEDAIGRYLTAEEQVHHLNAQREDNRESNLMLMPNFQEHHRLERNPPPWIPRCPCCGKPEPEKLTARPSWVPLIYDAELTYSVGPAPEYTGPEGI